LGCKTWKRQTNFGVNRFRVHQNTMGENGRGRMPLSKADGRRVRTPGKTVHGDRGGDPFPKTGPMVCVTGVNVNLGRISPGGQFGGNQGVCRLPRDLLRGMLEIVPADRGRSGAPTRQITPNYELGGFQEGKRLQGKKGKEGILAHLGASGRLSTRDHSVADIQDRPERRLNRSLLFLRQNYCKARQLRPGASRIVFDSRITLRRAKPRDWLALFEKFGMNQR